MEFSALGGEQKRGRRIFREGCDVRAVDRIYLPFASYPAGEGLAYPGTTTTQPGLESFGESQHIHTLGDRPLGRDPYFVQSRPSSHLGSPSPSAL